MTLTVNGEVTAYEGLPTLAELLVSMNADPERTATMLNDTIVKRDERAATALHENDRVEVLSFAGGG